MIDWDSIQKTLTPVKSYEELAQRLAGSMAYPFIRQNFNLPLSSLVEFIGQQLGGDTRGRYHGYAAGLTGILWRLHAAGVRYVIELVDRTGSRIDLTGLVDQSGIPAEDVIGVLKYLLYWFIPMEKPLIGLVPDDPSLRVALAALRGLGIRSNLELLQRGITAAGREELARACNLPCSVISDLVNRADLSRMPWASKATIANIIGAGYSSLARLASAEPQRLYADFFAYGAAIGKNLKLGNEIENSYRIARLLPIIVEEA